MRVSEIRVKRIRVNQGLGVIRTIAILQIHQKMLLHHFDMECILPHRYVPQLD